MSRLVLVINSGSSSLKCQLIDIEKHEVKVKENIERIGAVDGEFSDHEAALQHMLQSISGLGISLSDIAVVGHRVVHGGSRFSAPTLITPQVLSDISELSALAPLHNPANIVGINAVSDLLPDVAQVAVFDTAFHATIPDFASTYAISREVAQNYGIKRYGFHGTSHQFITRRLAEIINKPVSDVNAIICHIGNGASITAVVAGKSVDTSMGMTPLEGLVMGTRSGDLDPGIIFHLARTSDFSIGELDALLNRDSGLMGLTGLSDMRAVRELAEGGDVQAQLARAIYAYRITKYIGAYLAVVPQPDALVFTAGVGANDADLRALVIDPIAHLGLLLDDAANNSNSAGDRVISRATSSLPVMVIATDEEAEIARQAAFVVDN